MPDDQNNTTDAPDQVSTNLPKKGIDIRMILMVVLSMLVLLFGIFAAIAIPFSFLSLLPTFDASPTNAHASGGGGCYLNDESFTITQPLEFDIKLHELENQNENLRNSNKRKFDIDGQQLTPSEILISTARSNQVNPAILFAIWNGEASMRLNDAEFGCGVYTGSPDRHPGFKKQVDCAVKRVVATINKDKSVQDGLYAERPSASANRWTRFLYNYTVGDKDHPYGQYAYKNFGYVSGTDDPRIITMQKLVPSDVTCQAPRRVFGQGSGDKPADFFIQDIQQSWFNAKNDKGNNVVTKGALDVRGIVLHYTAGPNVSGAVSAMTERSTFVHLIIDKDGKVYQLLPLDSKVTSGSGDGNSFAIGIEIVGMNENDILSRAQPGNDAQYQAVINTVQYLIGAYQIPNYIGNTMNLEASVGIFGHFQTQSWNGSWSQGIEGCQGAKIDPGKEYMKKVWADPKIKSEVVGAPCQNIFN